MTDPRIIIPVLCGVVIVLAVTLAITIAAFKSALRSARSRAETWKREAEKATTRARLKNGALLALTKERDEARARLAKFTGPRERDAKGHFLPTVRNEAA